MSIYSGPETTDSGLILNLDVANPQSFGWSNPATALATVEVLVVAGGGGSGGGGNSGYQGGGGGGGGVVYHPSFAVSAPVAVTVGAGGAGGTQVADTGFRGGNGGDSSFGTLIAIGGGGGGGNSEANGANGGSGGGGNLYSGTGGISNQPTYSGATVYGNSGGTAQGLFTGGGAGGGGGGAGSAGGSANTVGTGGAGGFGVAFSINGTATFYGGGGAGQGGTANGAALNGATPANTAGTAGTGAGGGGRQSTSGLGGGSGIVIVRYPGTQRALGGTVTTVSGSTVHTFTSAGTFIPLTWSDVSGNGQSATLINGPSYNSSNDGSIVFDGVDDYVQTTAVVLPTANNAPFTLEAFCLTTSTTSYQTVLGTAGTFSQIGFLGTTFTAGRNGGGGNNLLSSLASVSTNTWYQLCMTYDGTTASFYLNGSFLSSGNIGSNGASNGVTVLGTYTAGSAQERLTGRVAIARVYNRAITAAEVNQNFQALRGRFGI